jgi:thiol-disulfide isomerase/thioredoxin
MKNSRLFRRFWALGAIAALCAVSANSEEIKLPWKSSGVTRQVGYYMPRQLALSPQKPDGITKEPAGIEAPLYGQLHLGPAGSPASFFVILDEPEGKPSRLFVDSKGSGDFTGVEPSTWEPKKYDPEKNLTQYTGNADISVPYGLENLQFHLFFYKFDKHDVQRASFANTLFYYRDFAREGPLSIGGKTYTAILLNDGCSGDFRGQPDEKSAPPPRLFIDVNGDGKFKMNSESFALGKPFNLGGTTYEFTNISASGDSFEIVKSTQTVEETVPQASLSAGHKAIPFHARTTDAKDVNFPNDYKGKIVLLDFWATWCGPCRAELPNVVAVYNKFHDKGFDVLSVSLDQENDGEKLAKFTRDNHMPWPQIYDGKFWHAEIAVAYAIDSIPRAYLVDGNSGEILGEGDDIRGEGLQTAVEKALEHRRAQ